MELDELYGKKLVEINKKNQSVELVFLDQHSKYRMKFEGFVFEAELSPMNQKVKRVHVSNSLGMKAIDLLGFLNYKNKKEFLQILFEFDEATFKKNELICICKNIELATAFERRSNERKFSIVGIEDLLFHYMVSNIPPELDELSTHTRINEVLDINLNEVLVEGERIRAAGDGIVNVALQYGSDADQVNDGGERFLDNYPFGFEVFLTRNRKNQLEVQSMERLRVDTSSYYK
jgi:hypothetical protein